MCPFLILFNFGSDIYIINITFFTTADGNEKQNMNATTTLCEIFYCFEDCVSTVVHGKAYETFIISVTEPMPV